MRFIKIINTYDYNTDIPENPVSCVVILKFGSLHVDFKIIALRNFEYFSGVEKIFFISNTELQKKERKENGLKAITPQRKQFQCV